MLEKKTEKQKNGKPWKNEARFNSFDEADNFRHSLMNSENAPEQVKVKYMPSTGHFVVKTRNLSDKKSKK